MKKFKCKILTCLLSLVTTSASLTTLASANDTTFVVIDVRTPAEFQESHLKDSLHIDISNDDFKEQIEKLDKNKSYKLYCRSGNRSGKALEIMKKQGFKNLENLGGLKQALKKTKIPCEGSAC